jgi:hypothetical protein
MMTNAFINDDDFFVGPQAFAAAFDEPIDVTLNSEVRSRGSKRSAL